MIVSLPANVDNHMFSPNTNWRATPIESKLQAMLYNGSVKVLRTLLSKSPIED